MQNKKNLIKYNNRVFNLEYFFCGDWKITSIVLGLNNATSNHPCIWCTANKSDFCDLEKNFSITDTKFFARSIDQHHNLMNKKKENLGYKCESLLKELSYNRCVIDLLHLFLRITDVLINLLIKSILLIDEIGSNTKIDYEIHKNTAKYFDL